MKKILISVSIIAAAAAVVVGATTAYFSDTETSSGNTFTAGAIDLKIDNHSYLNGQLNTATSWDLKDLTVEKFFNFADLKPGDNGEDTVSVHVDNNPAWACVTFKNLLNNDNSCTEPEDADDQTCGEKYDPNGGELAQNLQFFFWADVCDDKINTKYPDAVPGDNVYQPDCDKPLMDGPASDVLPGKTYPIADSTFSIAGYDQQGKPLPLEGSKTYYIGKAWCFGTGMVIDPNVPGKITCDGLQVNNASQSDSLTGNIEFTAIQSRNNDNFVCQPY